MQSPRRWPDFGRGEAEALLIESGLSADRIRIESGERDTKGRLPEYSYGYDRRVDVVVGGFHTP